MQPLSDADFLSLWESGLRRHPLDRALLALASALPEMSYAELADWPLGRRNRALTNLRCLCFGPALRAWTACVKCSEKLEFEMNAQLLAGEGTEVRIEMQEPIIVNGRTIRLPTSRDLARAAVETDPMAGAVSIVENCLVETGPPPAWSEEELSAIAERMALADPLAETRLTLRCPNCGNEWQETLDIVSFFWTEIEARVRQVLFAIHTLASAYGWSETEILSLSENRRALYLEMAQS